MSTKKVKRIKLPTKTLKGSIANHDDSGNDESHSDSKSASASASASPSSPVAAAAGSTTSATTIEFRSMYEVKETLSYIGQMLVAGQEGAADKDGTVFVDQMKQLMACIEGPVGPYAMQARQLALMTGVVVFKDLMPSYRLLGVDAAVAAAGGGRLSKDQYQQRKREAELAAAYERFVGLVGQCTGLVGRGGLQQRALSPTVRLTAVQALAETLAALPDQVCRDGLVDLLVRVACKPRGGADELRGAAVAGLRQLFERDAEQLATTRAVHAISQWLKRHQCVGFDPGLVEALDAIRFPDADLAAMGLAEQTVEERQRQHGKQQQQQRHRSRSQQKKRKDEARIELEFHEARTNRTRQVAHHRASVLLRAVFLVYVRILKAGIVMMQADGIDGGDAGDADENTENDYDLLLAALSGLGLRAHLVSVEFGADVLRCLASLAAADNGKNSDPAMLVVQVKCARTALDILGRQQHVVKADVSPYVQCLYRALLQLPALVFDQGGAWTAVAEDAVAAIRTALCDSRLLDGGSAAAFVQRASMAAVAAPPALAVSLVGLVRALLVRYPVVRTLLDEQNQDSAFDPFLDQPDQAGARTSVAWALTLLRTHFHPDVRALHDKLFQF